MTKPVLTQEQLRELLSHMVERVDGSTEEGLQAAYALGWKARGEGDAELCKGIGKDIVCPEECAAAIRKEDE